MKQTTLIIVALLVAMLIVSGCQGTPTDKSKVTPPTEDGNTQMANPASVNCIDKGGKLDIVTDETGGQVGMCKLKVGTVCEEWAYFRGECTKDYDVVNKTENSCKVDNDCETPGEYLMRSSCPFTSKCIDGTCSVVCPKFNGTAYPQVRACGDCPMLSQPAPNFCRGGNIVSGGTDECGCNKPPRCEKNTEQIACTMEAKLCPDGSAVGRTGPNCEFAPCPGESDVGQLEGKISIGPLCPVERVPPDPNCQPKQETFDAWPIGVYSGDTKVSNIKPNLDGTYSIDLKPGEYTVKLEKPSRIGGSNLPVDISIKSGENLVLDVDIDTGIR